jgi:glucose-6-phosphate isomerase
MTNSELATDNPASEPWQALIKQLRSATNPDICTVLNSDPKRVDRWTFQAAGLIVDLSKTPLNKNSLDILDTYAKFRKLDTKLKQLLSGGLVNHTEQRAAHHSALRSNDVNNSSADSHENLAATTHQRMFDIAGQLRDGRRLGASGQTIRDVVNIGIGGSDLGPRMVCTALQNSATHPLKVHFVANVDPAELETVLQQCKPATTLFIISSKSFATLETLKNADAARRWLLNDIGQEQLHQHLLAVTANTEAALAFGVSRKNVLPLWDWVGGRYSLWSAIGMPIVIAVGEQQFRSLLRGAQAMDTHFASTDFKHNLPVLLAMLDIININVLNAKSIAVLPYSHALRRLPAYLQQLFMESNGKSVNNSGDPVNYSTCPVIWGSSGTVGQHSFHQLLLQGSDSIPVEFILSLGCSNDNADDDRQLQLIANALAQSKALIEGKNKQQALDELIEAGEDPANAASLAKHNSVPGNRGNIIIAMQDDSAENLGALIALYEHRVFVQSVFWDINAFDQWGVELGKQMSAPISAALKGDNSQHLDVATQAWIKRYLSEKN